MDTALIVAIIAGAVALTSAAGQIWNSRSIERLKFDQERSKSAAARQKEISNYSEPLARSAYDLQSRLFNILRQGLLQIFLVNGNERERSYVINNTCFLIAQHLCCSELVRRDIQFIDLGENAKTRDLLRLQDTISSLWGTDKQPSVCRIFAGEQRAMGEALIQTTTAKSECMGYGTFLKTFTPGTNSLIDAVREDIASLGSNLGQATQRLRNVQNALIDLLAMLDPDGIRFPLDRRTKV